MARLRAQVEFYFGQQNLSRDTYLRNLLSQYGGTSVPLFVICNFPKVRDLCLSFNLHADPPLVMRALEGSYVAFVTPDANWISPMLPLPPLDAKVKMRPLPLGPRSMSISSSQEDVNKINVNVNGSAPSSPVKVPKGQAGQAQAQAQAGNANVTNGNGGNGSGIHTNNRPMQMQQQPQPQQPSMVRSRSHSIQPSHYNGHVTHSHPLPQGMPSPGYAPASPYSYPNVNVNAYRNMPPPGPGNYPQHGGYMYPPPMQHQHPHQHQHPPTGYPQMYPGFTYVTTSAAAGPPSNYFSHGRPGMVRNTSTSTARSAPAAYENGSRRQNQGPGSGGMAAPGGGGGSFRNAGGGGRQDAKGRKNRNKHGVSQNDSGTFSNTGGNGGGASAGASAGGRGGGMARRASREQMNQSRPHSDSDAGGGARDRDRDSNMPRNRSQNEMSDSSGGGKIMRRKKNKNKSETAEQRNDVSFDDNQFPALSPSKLAKSKEGGVSAEKTSVAMSGYAAALLQKNNAASAQSTVANASTSPVIEFSPPDDETDIVGKVSEMKLNADYSKDSDAAATPVAVGALTGTPLTEASSVQVDGESTRTTPKFNSDPPQTIVAVPAMNAKIEKKGVEIDGPTPQEAQESEMKTTDAKVESAKIVDIPLVKDSSLAAAPPSVWGNKRSFIDVVRKQP